MKTRPGNGDEVKSGDEEGRTKEESGGVVKAADVKESSMEGRRDVAEASDNAAPEAELGSADAERIDVGGTST